MLETGFVRAHGWKRIHEGVSSFAQKFVDWLMRLPENLALEFRVLRRELEAKNMQKYGGYGQLCVEEGIEQGTEQGTRASIVALLCDHFGSAPESITNKLDAIKDITVLKALLLKASHAKSLAEFEAWAREVTGYDPQEIALLLERAKNGHIIDDNGQPDPLAYAVMEEPDNSDVAAAVMAGVLCGMFNRTADDKITAVFDPEIIPGNQVNS